MLPPPTDPPRYEVAVLFRQGHGDRFHSAEAALDYADAQMQTLLAEYEALEAEDFDGIYCTRTDTDEVWRFDYEDGAAAWIADPTQSELGDRHTAIILQFRLRKAE